jgi:methionine-gamma-lyase
LLTKYIGGHSDLIAGAALGSNALMKDVKALRGAIGTQMDPFLLDAQPVARNTEHPHGKGKVAKVITLRTTKRTLQPAVCSRDNAPARAAWPPTMSNENVAFKFLNALQIVKLAVSLGGNESLASLPATHSGVPADIRQRVSVLDSTIRLSIGI